jgi:hypothetical protein
MSQMTDRQRAALQRDKERIMKRQLLGYDPEGSTLFDLNFEDQANRGRQRFANFLGGISNIPGFVGLKGIFPGMAVPRDAATAFPDPYRINERGNMVKNRGALRDAAIYNQQYDDFLGDPFGFMAPNPQNEVKRGKLVRGGRAKRRMAGEGPGQVFMDRVLDPDRKGPFTQLEMELRGEL